MVTQKKEGIPALSSADLCEGRTIQLAGGESRDSLIDKDEHPCEYQCFPFNSVNFKLLTHDRPKYPVKRAIVVILCDTQLCQKSVEAYVFSRMVIAGFEKDGDLSEPAREWGGLQVDVSRQTRTQTRIAAVNSVSPTWLGTISRSPARLPIIPVHLALLSGLFSAHRLFHRYITGVQLPSRYPCQAILPCPGPLRYSFLTFFLWSNTMVADGHTTKWLFFSRMFG